VSRPLKAEEIDLRVGRFNETRSGKVIANFLLYKDARVDMALLDEMYPNKWKREHKEIGGNLYCIISVWNDEIKQWITREDVGTESFSDKEKGQASDSFKRSGFNFDIGRELYSKGCKNISVFMDSDEVYKNGKGKWNLSFGVSFHVSHIESEKGQVFKLEISDQNGKVRYKYPNDKTITPQKPKQQPQQPKTWSKESVINFGKHKGQTIKEIWKHDKNYLNYLKDNAQEQSLKDYLAQILKPSEKEVEKKFDEFIGKELKSLQNDIGPF